VFADCFCAVHIHQLEFANTSLPTLVCRVKAALVVLVPITKTWNHNKNTLNIMEILNNSWVYGKSHTNTAGQRKSWGNRGRESMLKVL